MTNDRIIRFSPDAETMTSIAEITGNAELFKAIGYLSSWNTTGHKYVEIIAGVYDGIPEIIATYRGEERGPITYQIGAVWHPAPAGSSDDGHFGFHS